MKKLVLAVFAVAMFASVASAYDWTVGGQFGYSRMNIGGDTMSSWTIAPEVAKIINEDVNVGVGLSYVKNPWGVNMPGATNSYINMILSSTLLGADGKAYGGYLFGEYAVIGAGAFKVYLRGDIAYTRIDTDASNDNINLFAITIAPNIQYGLTERLTLIASSNVLSLGYSHISDSPFGGSMSFFGLNAGQNADIKIGLKYAF